MISPYPPMKLYLVRHGESEFNKERLHQDHTPLLSERGIEQAHFVARRLKNVPLTTIIASPYSRAKHTAEIIAEHLNLPLEFSDTLVETRRPSEVVGQGHESDIAREIDRLYRENIDDPDWKYSDEESFAEMRTRAQKVFNLLDTHNDETVLLVSHGNFIRMLVALVLFGDAVTKRELQSFRDATLTSNTGITILNRHDDCTHRAGLHWQMISWNDHAHLA